MRDAFTNFGNIAVVASATESSKAIKSENIVDLVCAGKLEASVRDFRFVFYPKETITDTIVVEVLQSDTLTGTGASRELSSPVVTDTFSIVNPKKYHDVIKPFVLETKARYMQLRAYCAGAKVCTISAYLEEGAGAQ